MRLLFFSSLCSASALENLSDRVEDLAYSWQQEFHQYKEYQQFLSGSIDDFKLLISQSRTRRHYFPLVLGDKLELLERFLSHQNLADPPCPPGSFTTPFLPSSGPPRRICVRSSRDLVSDFLKWDGYLEDCRRATHQALQTSETCHVVVDVGANIGACTLDFASHFRVLAVEPNPTSFALLLASVRLNGLTDKVVLLRAAVASEPDLDLSFYEPLHNAGASSIAQEGGASQEGGVQFTSRSVTLSSIIESVPCVQLLKLDCEGCEAEAVLDLHSAGMLDKVVIVKVELTQTNDQVAEALYVLSQGRELYVFNQSGKRLVIGSIEHAFSLVKQFGIIDLYAQKLL